MSQLPGGSWPANRLGMNEERQWETACSVEELTRDGLREHMSGRTLLVLAWLDGAPWAGTGLCPHNFARLVDGRVEGGRLHCYRHQASFCMATGAADNRWQIKGLTLYPTRIEDGFVQVAVR